MQGKEYLIDLFQILNKNLQYNREFYAIEEIVDKMYLYDKEKAIEWSIYLLNKFSTKGLADFKNGESDIISFIEELLIMLCANVSYKEIIPLIHDKIVHDNRIYIWKFILDTKNFNSYILDYIEETIDKNNDKEFKELKTFFGYIADNQNLIEEDAINLIDFFCEILETFVNKEYIKNRKQLDFFYSLIEYVPYQPENALLKSYFIDFI